MLFTAGTSSVMKNIYEEILLLIYFCFLYSECCFVPKTPECPQMFAPARLLEMGFSMRHIYKAMEAAGTSILDHLSNSIIIVLVRYCFGDLGKLTIIH